MTHVVRSFFQKIVMLTIGTLLSIIGFGAALFIGKLDKNEQYTMVQMAQIQRDIKQIEVSIASINARLLTTDQVRLIAAEVVDSKISQAMLTHVRTAHEK